MFDGLDISKNRYLKKMQEPKENLCDKFLTVVDLQYQ